MDATYAIQIKAFLMADDDRKTSGSALDASAVAKRIEQVNTIYASAKLQFLFNPATDAVEIASTLLNREFTILDPSDIGSDGWSKKPLIDEKSHDDAREQLASLFPGRLVIFFRTRSALKQENGIWKVVGGGGSSDGNASHVNMPRSYGSAELLAHEIGHYLQLVHPFVDSVKTVKKAAEKITHYVQEEKHPDSEGWNVLDGDRAWVLDTPPDARGSIFEPERSARRDFITYWGLLTPIHRDPGYQDQGLADFGLPDPRRGRYPLYFFGDDCFRHV